MTCALYDAVPQSRIARQCSTAEDPNSDITVVMRTTTGNIMSARRGAPWRSFIPLNQVMSDPAAGREIQITMKDSRWPASDGWVKMTQNVNGVRIHYVLNTL